VSATFWFLLEYSVFFTLVALVFGLVGWWLRGPGRDSRSADLERQLAEQQNLARSAMDERDAALAEARDGSTHVSDAARIIEENQALENANIQLQNDLRTARHELNAQSETLAAALTTAARLEAENARLLSQSADALTDSSHRTQRAESELAQLKTAHEAQIAELQRQIDPSAIERLTAEAAQNAQRAESELAQLKTAHEAQIAELQPQIDPSAIERLTAENARLISEAAQNARRAESELAQLKTAHEAQIAELQRPLEKPLTAVPPPAAEPAAVAKPAPKPKMAKPKVPRSTKSTATAVSADDKLAQIEHELAPQLAVLAALTQERDDWAKRVHKLENQSLPDPAGLGLSRRSLIGSQERLTTAQEAAQSLQNQQRALQKALSQSAERGELPGDDLTQIKGIKTVLSDQLHAHGIRTWRQIAEWNDDDLAAFSELLAFKNRATRDNWREQARQLHEATHGPLV
jgi:predicted flap endonuclease-1-like 5' DNA nuclease